MSAAATPSRDGGCFQTANLKNIKQHCYGSRANLGPVSNGVMKNITCVQENID